MWCSSYAKRMGLSAFTVGRGRAEGMSGWGEALLMGVFRRRLEALRSAAAL